jgi:hypothetical protein
MRREQEHSMKQSSVAIFVRYSKVYLPTQGWSDKYGFVSIGPVYCASLSQEELVATAEKILAAGHPRVSEGEVMTLDSPKKSPILQMMRARSWAELSRTGAAYDIRWTVDEIRINMTKRDPAARWEYDSEKRRVLPRTTPLREIITLVLEDVQSRPELLQPPPEPQKRTRKKNP